MVSLIPYTLTPPCTHEAFNPQFFDDFTVSPFQDNYSMHSDDLTRLAPPSLGMPSTSIHLVHSDRLMNKQFSLKNGKNHERKLASGGCAEPNSG